MNKLPTQTLLLSTMHYQWGSWYQVGLLIHANTCWMGLTYAGIWYDHLRHLKPTFTVVNKGLHLALCWSVLLAHPNATRACPWDNIAMCLDAILYPHMPVLLGHYNFNKFNNVGHLCPRPCFRTGVPTSGYWLPWHVQYSRLALLTALWHAHLHTCEGMIPYW